MYRPYVCPATGHIYERRVEYGELSPDDAICPKHGVPLFRNCPSCGTRWPMTHGPSYSTRPSAGANFCGKCAAPGPWLTRRELITWIQSLIQVATDLPTGKRHELREVLEHLQTLAPDDTKAVAGWQKVRDAVPKVWATTKPVRDALMVEAVKKLVLG